jgi:hypothetical protein
MLNPTIIITLVSNFIEVEDWFCDSEVIFLVSSSK